MTAVLLPALLLAAPATQPAAFQPKNPTFLCFDSENPCQMKGVCRHDPAGFERYYAEIPKISIISPDLSIASTSTSNVGWVRSKLGQNHRTAECAICSANSTMFGSSSTAGSLNPTTVMEVPVPCFGSLSSSRFAATSVASLSHADIALFPAP